MPAPDEVSTLTAIALFLWSASSEIIGVQSLQNGCMNRFKSALNSCDPWVSYTSTVYLSGLFRLTHCDVTNAIKTYMFAVWLYFLNIVYLLLYANAWCLCGGALCVAPQAFLPAEPSGQPVVWLLN